MHDVDRLLPIAYARFPLRAVCSVFSSGTGLVGDRRRTAEVSGPDRWRAAAETEPGDKRVKPNRRNDNNTGLGGVRRRSGRGGLRVGKRQEARRVTANGFRVEEGSSRETRGVALQTRRSGGGEHKEGKSLAIVATRTEK